MPRRASLKTIERAIKELQAKAEAIQQAEKPGIAQLKAVVAKFKLRPVDIKLALTGSGTRRASKAGGKPLKPKFRNPAKKSETWAGRGLKPKWLSALLKQGKKLEDFAV